MQQVGPLLAMAAPHPHQETKFPLFISGSCPAPRIRRDPPGRALQEVFGLPWEEGLLMCTEGSLGEISKENPYHSSSSPTDDICPKPPTIANGYVEHTVRYGCQEFYQLRSEGDGKIPNQTLCYAWGQGPKIPLFSLF